MRKIKNAYEKFEDTKWGNQKP